MGANRQGKFITLEGIDGAGKSTHICDTEQYLREQGVNVITTSEPGGSELGCAIRDLLLNPKYNTMQSHAELLLMFAARIEHVDKKILPALRQGQWVLCERFTDSSYAYQSGGREIDKAVIDKLRECIGDANLRPDLTILLDIPLTEALQRVAHRGATPDRFEQETKAFFKNIVKFYHELAESDKKRWEVIDSTMDYQEVQTAINKRLQILINEGQRV